MGLGLVGGTKPAQGPESVLPKEVEFGKGVAVAADSVRVTTMVLFERGLEMALFERRLAMALFERGADKIYFCFVLFVF